MIVLTVNLEETKFMTTVFKSNRISLLCYALISPLSTLTSTAFAMSLQPVIDVGLSGNMETLISTSLAAVIIAILSVLFSYIADIQKKKVVTSYIKNLQLHYFSTFFHQDIACFLEKDSATYLSKLTVDAEAIGQKFCESILNIYNSFWSLFISILCIALTRWELAIYVIVFSFLSVNLPKFFQKKANYSEQDYLDSNKTHINLVQESIRNYLVIRFSKLISSQMNKYEKVITDVEKKSNVRQKKLFTVDAVAGAITSISYVLIITSCMLLVVQGKLSVGYTMSVSQLLGGIMFPFEVLPGYLLAYRTGKNIYIENEAELQENMKTGGNKRLCLTHTDDYIEIDKMSFAYSSDQPLVLNNISLCLNLKRKYAVVGKSGSGKSTLAKIIMGILNPVDGTVFFNGIPIAEIDRSTLYDVVTYQNQTISFFDDTIKENILLGKNLPENTWDQIISVSCLDNMLNKLPNKELTIIDENGKNISGGEAQRICLARCLSRQPAFIIFDEIVASLDSQNARAIEKSILSLENVGILQITHRIYEENMRQYDSIFVLKDGKISEQGTWDELMAKRGDFYQLVIHANDLDDKSSKQ